MEKSKKKIILIGVILILLLTIGTLSFILLTKDKPKDKEVVKDVTYEISFKVNPLVKFYFNYDGDKAYIKDFELLNDKAKEVFGDTNFKNMELNAAIDLYGDKLKEDDIHFNSIYVWTTWDKTDYFHSEKYDLKVNKVDNLNNIEDLTKPKLLYNEKYYLEDGEHGYSVVFKEDGTLEYYIEEGYTEKVCDEVYEIEPQCYEYTYEKGRIYEDYNHIFTVDGNTVTMKGVESYFGWVYHYDVCEIGFNKLKCDNYNSYSGLDIEYRYTSYYEVK